jgi:hypothetical protein
MRIVDDDERSAAQRISARDQPAPEVASRPADGGAAANRELRRHPERRSKCTGAHQVPEPQSRARRHVEHAPCGTAV